MLSERCTLYNCSREALSVVAFGPSVRVCVLVNSSAVPRDSGRGPPAAAPSAVETPAVHVAHVPRFLLPASIGCGAPQLRLRA